MKIYYQVVTNTRTENTRFLIYNLVARKKSVVK